MHKHEDSLQKNVDKKARVSKKNSVIPFCLNRMISRLKKTIICILDSFICVSEIFAWFSECNTKCDKMIIIPAERRICPDVP